MYALNNFHYSIVVLNYFKFGVLLLSTTLHVWLLQIQAESETKAPVIAFRP